MKLSNDVFMNMEKKKQIVLIGYRIKKLNDDVSVSMEKPLYWVMYLFIGGTNRLVIVTSAAYGIF